MYIFAGRGGKREEDQALHHTAPGFGSDSGLPRCGSVLLQPEVPVEPQSGKGKTKYQLTVCQSAA